MGDLGNALDGRIYIEGFADVLLYLVRHVALYVGISKFVVDWGGNDGIFEKDERAWYYFCLWRACMWDLIE